MSYYYEVNLACGINIMALLSPNVSLDAIKIGKEGHACKVNMTY